MFIHRSIYLFTVLLSACATTASGVKFAELPLSKIYTDTKAKIVVFRPNSVAGGGKPIEVLLDGKSVGEIMKGGYLIIDAEPGKREIKTNTATLDLKKRPQLGRGETLFYKIDFLTGAGKLIQIDDKTVNKEFGDYQSSL